MIGSSIEDNRIAEAEKKIDGIYSFLGTGPTPQAILRPQPVQPSVSQSNLLAQVNDIWSENLPLRAPYLESLADRDSSAYEGGPLGPQDVIQRGIITIREAETLLQAFRPDHKSFPFVIVPPQLSLNDL